VVFPSCRNFAASNKKDTVKEHRRMWKRELVKAGQNIKKKTSKQKDKIYKVKRLFKLS